MMNDEIAMQILNELKNIRESIDALGDIIRNK
jgi:hypothetical protein